MPLDGLLLDRDGVILEMVVDGDHGLVDSARRPEDVRLLPGAAELIVRMNTLGIPVACLTNQPGIAKGTLQPRHVQAVHAEMARQLAAAGGAVVDYIGVCPHHPSGSVASWSKPCACRKPAPGLLIAALERFDLKPDRTLFVGDGVTDVAAGRAAMTSTLLVGPLKNYTAAELDRYGVWPDYTAPNLIAARPLIERLIADRDPKEPIPMDEQRSPFSQQYLDLTAQIARDVDRSAVESVVDHLSRTRDAGGRVFVAGNGGGAAHASHFTADIRTLAGIEAYCVSDNAAELTAQSNDHGWLGAYSGWLSASRIGHGDVLFIFSVGGGSSALGLSENLVAAVDTALTAGATVSGFVGPEGGHVVAHAESCVRVPVPAGAGVTAHTESFQAVLGHLIVTHPRLRTGTPTWEQRAEGRSNVGA